jgi:polyphosphate kinase 2 (PPK2 family)
MPEKRTPNNGKFQAGARSPRKADPASASSKSFRSLRLGEDSDYDRELRRLQIELVKLHEWIRHDGLKVVILFEGPGRRGQGRYHQAHHPGVAPRIGRGVGLSTPTEREKTQWYFQRYVAHLPSAGEMVLFDRSWYNRAVSST